MKAFRRPVETFHPDFSKWALLWTGQILVTDSASFPKQLNGNRQAISACILYLLRSFELLLKHALIGSHYLILIIRTNGGINYMDN